MRNLTFLLCGARPEGNSELLARKAAESLPPTSVQHWVSLAEFPLPRFEDLRHAVGIYPPPQGNAKTLLEATLACTDLVFVTPLYWYSLPAQAKRYLEEWSAWMRVKTFEGQPFDFKARLHGKTMWAIAVSSGEEVEAQPLVQSLRLSAEYMSMRWGGHVLGNGSKPGEVLNDSRALEAASVLFER